MLRGGDLISKNEDEIEYSFASEYNGPPISYELPQAIPIDIKKIPVASVVSQKFLREKLSSLPIVQPINASGIFKKKFSKEFDLGVDSVVVSPTSVIRFDERGRFGRDSEVSGECNSSGLVGSPVGHEQSCEISNVIDGLEKLESSCDCELLCELSRRIDDSGTLESNENNDHSCEILSDSASSSHFLVELSSKAEEDCGNVASGHTRRPSVVTFRDEDSCDSVPDGPETKVQIRSCYRCSKGNRFSEKETCIVCNAKYCANCVLRAMGSMPEGRKCVTCIGYPIDESKRKSLGKCSRILKRLLSELEIRQIMNAEKLSEANQLQAARFYVNGKKLSAEELILLQSCPHPPTQLKPGCYWYDKVSGLWGKEGHKPCKFISPHLDVGGDIKGDASNGNTNVFINNREITKVELRLLRCAGVQCAGNPHFWLDEYGAYQEEGQKTLKGNLWDKAGTKLLSVVLSLPIPSSKTANSSAEPVNNLVNRTIPEYLKQRTIQKLLLVGYNGSGTSTIFKQAKILYKAEPFSEHERQDIKFMIQSNIYSYLAILLEGRERFEEESLPEMKRKRLLNRPDYIGSDDEGKEKTVYSIVPRLKAFSDWLLTVRVSGNLDDIFPAATREYAPLVEELWKNPAIQATFDRRSELETLPSVASYFLERIVDITRPDYEPSNVDILYAEGTSSNGIASMDFSFPQLMQQGIVDAANQQDLRCQLIRVDARGLGENGKWLEMFEDIRMVIFCVALSDYDQFCDDSSGVPTNKILASRKVFENIVTHPTFEKMDFLLILTKYDLLEEKILRVPLSECSWFLDFNLVRSHASNNNSINYIASPAEQAFQYIAVKFKRLFNSLTGRKLYVSLANGMEPNTISAALTYAREILKWDEEKANINFNDSFFNSGTSFSS
ncbi:hypothetical protein AQUCO_01000356v1 [Aquilegia coerulea]|uniref:Uncharacterized protein n=1 Tax=Aquilegia coerulea TaxID=218851 RepID=A0A2G5E9J9_AQUCA|nr:hypothetical protein AQUCO_01000356v1 [Aquilegia coerulea]